MTAQRRPPGVREALTARLLEMRSRISIEKQSAAMARLKIAFPKTFGRARGNAYTERFLTQAEQPLRHYGRPALDIPGGDAEITHERAVIGDATAARGGDAAEFRASEHVHRSCEMRAQELLGRTQAAYAAHP